MSAKWAEIAVIPIAAVLVGGFLWFEHLTQPEVPEVERPDFTAFADVKEKKAAFFSYMLPFVRAVNDEIRRERRRVTKLTDQVSRGKSLRKTELEYLSQLAADYRMKSFSVDDPEQIKELRNRVDTIPASLALAQAANESGWGTSRFARDGNNFFGIWCWSRDCGLTPKKRSAGETHKVTAYDNVSESVRFYIHTLNTHPAYGTLRDIRAHQREQNHPVTGHDLALGLESYSERGPAYIKEIRDIIRVNQLRRFTQVTANI